MKATVPTNPHTSRERSRAIAVDRRLGCPSSGIKPPLAVLRANFDIVIVKPGDPFKIRAAGELTAVD